MSYPMKPEGGRSGGGFDHATMCKEREAETDGRTADATVFEQFGRKQIASALTTNQLEADEAVEELTRAIMQDEELPASEVQDALIAAHLLVEAVEVLAVEIGATPEWWSTGSNPDSDPAPPVVGDK
jgi:hypothetical protein